MKQTRDFDRGIYSIADIFKMTQEEARQWLIDNDRDGSHYWSNLPLDTNFRFEVWQNCNDEDTGEAADAAQIAMFDAAQVVMDTFGFQHDWGHRFIRSDTGMSPRELETLGALLEKTGYYILSTSHKDDRTQAILSPLEV